MRTEAQRYPGQESAGDGVLPQEPAGRRFDLRGPIFEEKVVDFILELSRVTDQTVESGGADAEPDAEPDAAGYRRRRTPAPRRHLPGGIA